MDDEAIVELYWQRSDRAIPVTAAKYERYCFTIAQRILEDRENADECVNDTWLAAWNAMPPQRPGLLSTFLGKITRRLALGVLRRENRLKRGGGQHTLVFEELADCLPDTEEGRMEESLALRDLIRRFLEGLPRSEREIFLARYWFFASVREISERSGFSESKVKSMLYRTRGHFRTFLAGEGYDYDKT